MATVRFEHVHKLFDSTPVVRDLSLEVGDGEFVVLVGPSGCGKTTTLRMLAGFERPTYGRVFIDDGLMNRVPPRERDVAMVFQNYALFPHMTVFKNLSFGMRIRREPRRDIVTRVGEVARLLGIEDLLDRRPAQLSGGQRQRVALGRALIRRPKVFLMDEPLSNLDAALRVQMRVELSRLHDRFKTTTLYVTHDQIEAMTMGSRIAVMRDGELQQFDTPERLYALPANLFVASFIGSPKMNLSPGRVVPNADHPAVACYGLEVPVSDAQQRALLDASAPEIIVGLRPEDLRWGKDAPGTPDVRVCGVVEVVEPLGAETYVVVSVQGQSLTSRFPPRAGVRVGDRVELALDPSHLHFFDRGTERALTHGGDETGRAVSGAPPGLWAAEPTSPGPWRQEPSEALEVREP